MIECRHCREIFRKAPERIGARCPTCRMPLFEREKQRTPVVDLGPCAIHADNQALAKCQRCARMMCAVCRTRWEEEIVCPGCLEKALAAGETSPRLIRQQNRQAVGSVVLGLLSWALLLILLWLGQGLTRGTPGTGLAVFAVFFFLASFLPSLFAIGQGAACIRSRGQRMSLAAWGVSIASLHLGACLGILFLNVFIL